MHYKRITIYYGDGSTECHNDILWLNIGQGEIVLESDKDGIMRMKFSQFLSFAID